MKTVGRNYALAICAALVCVFSASSPAAIETNVSTVAELVGALEYINSLSSKDRNNTIKLAAGNYDVSECAMTCIYTDNGSGTPTDKNTHLAMNYVTIVGATENPRDTVIYGGGEAKSRGVICGRYSTVRDLTISNGWAGTASGGGYAGYHTTDPGSTMRELVSNCVVTCCRAGGNWGGGSAVAGVKAYDSEFCHNETMNSNCFGAANKCDLYRCFVHSNHSSSYGGGIGSCYAYDCIISNNTSASGGAGVGVSSSSYKYLISGCKIVGNSASTTGGGMYAHKDSPGMVTNTLIAGNSAIGNCGGVYGARCIESVISNNCVNVNASGNAYGAGAYTTRLSDCDVCFNYIAGQVGGKGNLYGAGTYDSVLTGCRVHGNAILGDGTYRQGAGLYSSVATNSVVYENFCNGSSSGVGMNGGSAFNCVFSNNQANVTWNGYQIRQPSGPLVNCEFYSQAIECASDVLIENCRIWGHGGWRIPAGHNIASMSADLSGNDPVTPYICSASIHMRNCLIVSNTANYICKGYEKNGMTFENCTFADNCLEGTFINMYGADPTSNAVEAVNCIFTRNYNKAGTARCDFRLSTGTNVTLRNCLIGSSRAIGTLANETGTVTADNAKFNAKSATDPYEIRRSSPAFGKGLVLNWMTSEATDIRASAACPRLRDGVVDIGCYQCWLKPRGYVLSFH